MGESDVVASEVEELMEPQIPETERESIHLTWAKLIEGAVGHAERLGIAPLRDFRKARKVPPGSTREGGGNSRAV